MITALSYILPLTGALFRARTEYRVLKYAVGTGEARWGLVPALLARGLFSTALLVRMGGILNGSILGGLGRECLVVEGGLLLQTPFRSECMGAVEWVLVGVTGTAVPVTAYLVAFYLWKCINLSSIANSAVNILDN